jgi:hypothetical protein
LPNIDWTAVPPAGGRLDQPNRVEILRFADAAASATFVAFEQDKFGNTEDRYLRVLIPRHWRRGTAFNALTSSGLKVHPWSETTRSAYP